MKIAIIGTGQIAQRHLKAFQHIEGAQIVGHLGTTQAKASAAAQTWGGQGYTSLDELIVREKPDAVWVTVPPHQHGAIEDRLLEDRIPFLVEKPLSADRKTAEQIGNAIAQKNSLVAVGYNWRALDTLPALRKHLAKNPAHLVIGAFHVNTPTAIWWRHRAESGGQIVEQATHLIDLSRALLGNASLLCAQGATFNRSTFLDADIAGVSMAMLRFERACIGTFTASCILSQPVGASLELISENGFVTLTRESISYQIGMERRTEVTQADTYEVQNRGFLAAIEQNNSSLILSTYADALLTHHLCHDIADRVEA